MLIRAGRLPRRRAQCSTAPRHTLESSDSCIGDNNLSTKLNFFKHRRKTNQTDSLSSPLPLSKSKSEPLAFRVPVSSPPFQFLPQNPPQPATPNLTEPSLMTSDSDHASSGICFVDPTSSHFPASSSATAGADADVEALKRLSENLRSIFQSEDFAFCADATITCNSRDLPVHRCVLSARSPFFRDFFSKNRENTGAIEARDLLGDFEVEYDALVLVMEYIYSGRVGQLPKGVCICADETCSHAGCWPAVRFMVEVLYSSFTFHIFELVNLFQVCFFFFNLVIFLYISYLILWRFMLGNV